VQKTSFELKLLYLNRIRGDRAENLENAIAGYEAALEIYTKEDFPIDWAMTQNNRANAYLNRIRGDRAENLENAIAGYKAALEIYTKEDFPIDWAMTQNNCANAYSDRIRGDRVENLENAIVQEYLEKAIACYEAALEIRTKEDLPINWAETQANIAIFCVEQGEDDQAIIHYLQAIKIFQPLAFPINALKAHRGLGNIYLKQSHWQQAINAYEIAMQAAELSRLWSVDDDERQRVLREALSVYENAIQCAVNLKDYKLAISYTERIRSRQLVELMASKDLYSDAQVPPEIQGYLAEYHQLGQKSQAILPDSDAKLATTKTHRDGEDLRRASADQQIIAAQRKILYDKIRAFDPVLAGQIAIAPITHTEIQKLIPNAQTAILTFYSTDDDTHIFILKHNQEPEVFTVPSQGKQALQQWLIENWRNPYNENKHEWLEQMPQVLAELADRLQLPQLITNHLDGIQELILVPHLLLHQIPFAALPIPKDRESQQPDGLLGERFTLRSIPSCQILQYCENRDPITTSTQGIVEDADGSLVGARYEGQKIAEIYQVQEGDRLRGKTQATVANYRQLLGRINRLHSSHHAYSNLLNPLESALILADGTITLSDLLLGERYPHLDEIFLSACETHVGNLTLTDDVATLTTGFLCIGARSVQSTIWSVSDIVTAIFNIFYHQERREGYNRVDSLKRAQVRLRNLSGDEFKLNYAQELHSLFSSELPALAEAIDQITAELEAIDMDLEEERWEKVAVKKSELCRIEARVKGELAAIADYCTAQKPFESPFFWAGFICQGMA
jgi:CHAT domain-containing protein